MRGRGKAAAPHIVPGERAVPPTATIDLDEAGDTPILREYRAVKEQHGGGLLLARLGDFYELFGADAEVAAPILGVTLTGRGFGSAGRVPMCGVPYHAAPQYIRRLLDAGRTVVLWDQVGEVAPGRLVRREVTRIISPGTVFEADFLDAVRTARLVALAPRPGRVGVAAFDASGGELQLFETPGDLSSPALLDECARLEVAELIVPEGCEVPERVAPGAARTALPLSLFDLARAETRLKEASGTVTLRGFGSDELPAARSAAGAVLAYAQRSRLMLSAGFVRPRVRSPEGTMRLDPQTRRNLELLAPLGQGGTTLAQLLDHTRTPMGARLLRSRLQEPLVDAVEINRRLDAVAALVAAPGAVDAVRAALDGVRDLERLVGRCVQGAASPRDLAAIRDACDALPRCAAALETIDSEEIREAARQCVAPDQVGERLRALLVEQPPPSAREGGAIRPGADADLDNLHAASSDARAFIATLEERERQRTGIRSLRVGYNRVFGYYLEVPNAHRDGVPPDYIRKQTLVGAERYVTPDIKEQEAIVLHARERAVEREVELLREAGALVAAHVAALLGAAAAAAALDVHQSLARCAQQEGWSRPAVDGETHIEIEAGRHPLVEHGLGPGRFVPNDCRLDGGEHQLMVLTGPNMAGKSTYLRQVALCVLLAQMGSFVPAGSARIGLCDRIFTRIGAHDDLAAGLSTFMVEMSETAAILNQATPRSLVVLDEIGRGTSTYDGLSIAQAVVEHLHESPRLGCRTLFATHYHELTALAASLPRVCNARVEVVEDGDAVTFLHRIVEGAADRSYGIHVAKLAGVPAGVVARARQLLAELERSRPIARGGEEPDQLSLPLAVQKHPLVAQLAQLDIDGLTPLQALNTIAQWREQLDE
ncbi:MAG TPA: DNA mismatch repair protein MutS [Candidatus Sulfotelmatobacter sp.]|nr:DNA mismatch repair protein MutS [Candidatus Sulfotelmatobacter sp.]